MTFVEDVIEGYKMTEMGILPEEWDVVRFADSISKEKNRTPSSILKSQYQDVGKYPIIDQSMDYIAGYTDCESKVFIRPLPLIIFGDHTRIFKYIDFPFAIGADGTKLLFPKQENFNPKFLYFYFSSLDIPSKGYNRHFKLLKEKYVALPPLSEQQKIASVLSTIQEAKEKTENVINALKELKKSMMKHLFTYGPVSVEDAEKVPLKETEIGTIPEHWEVKKFGDIAKQRKESVIPSVDGNTKYIGLEHIDSGEIRLKRHGFDNEVRSSKCRFYKGDILYGKLRPYLDKCVLVDFEGICSTDIIVVTHSKEVQGDYLANLMHMDGLVKYATQTMTGVNHPRTSWKALSLFKVPYPSLTEQQHISEILTAIDKKIEAEETKKNSLESLFKTLLSLLMTGKIRVKDLDI